MHRFTINSKSSLLEALKRLNELPGNAMTLIVTDDDGCAVGTLTDGDVRRALLSGATTDSAVGVAAHAPFRAVKPGMTPADVVDELRRCRSLGIKVVPRIGADSKLAEIIDLSTSHTRLPLRALLMAGGKGERLRPLTLNTPKPLLEIDGKAIIDYNIEALAACGIKDITVATGYMAEAIEEHFAKPVGGVQVKCIRETQPLGTAGALTLLPPSQEATLLMNSDLLTTIDFEEMYLRHHRSAAAASVAAIPYQVSVPYAILTTKGTAVTGIAEKPSYSYFANAGIYIFENEIISALTPDKRVDATDVVASAVAAGLHVECYPIKGTWIDIGSPVDFAHASELMRHHRTLTRRPE